MSGKIMYVMSYFAGFDSCFNQNVSYGPGAFISITLACLLLYAAFSKKSLLLIIPGLLVWSAFFFMMIGDGACEDSASIGLFLPIVSGVLAAAACAMGLLNWLDKMRADKTLTKLVKPKTQKQRKKQKG